MADSAVVNVDVHTNMGNVGMASAGSAIWITVIFVGRLLGVMWLRRGWWARTPSAMLPGGGTVMVSLSLIWLRRDDALTGKRVEIRVRRVFRMIRGLWEMSRRLGVWRLMVGVV